MFYLNLETHLWTLKLTVRHINVEKISGSIIKQIRKHFWHMKLHDLSQDESKSLWVGSYLLLPFGLWQLNSSSLQSWPRFLQPFTAKWKTTVLMGQEKASQVTFTLMFKITLFWVCISAAPECLTSSKHLWISLQQ